MATRSRKGICRERGALVCIVSDEHISTSHCCLFMTFFFMQLTENDLSKICDFLHWLPHSRIWASSEQVLVFASSWSAEAQKSTRLSHYSMATTSLPLQRQADVWMTLNSCTQTVHRLLICCISYWTSAMVCRGGRHWRCFAPERVDVLLRLLLSLSCWMGGSRVSNQNIRWWMMPSTVMLI
jgi:hypothetical protein